VTILVLLAASAPASVVPAETRIPNPAAALRAEDSDHLSPLLFVRLVRVLFEYSIQTGTDFQDSRRAEGAQHFASSVLVFQQSRIPKDCRMS
jgi:hypothetical protein